jgi:hypothetical protein
VEGKNRILQVSDILGPNGEIKELKSEGFTKLHAVFFANFFALHPPIEEANLSGEMVFFARSNL